MEENSRLSRMELRSMTKQNEEDEKTELKKTLEGMGYYDVTDLTEMREILEALQMSEQAYSVEKSINSQSFEFQNENMLNSTMNTSYKTRHFSSPESSPDYQVIEVKAIVHHPMDWSPSQDALLSNAMRKRNSVQAILESYDKAAKRLRYDSIEYADSGVNLSSPSFSTQKTHTSKLDDALNNNVSAMAFIDVDEWLQNGSAEPDKLHCGTADKEVKGNDHVVDLLPLFPPESVTFTGYHDPNESWD